MTRFYWRRAHPVRIPDKVNTPPHLELFAAYARDQAMAELKKDVAALVDQDLREERV